MNSTTGSGKAGSISVAETLELLDGDFSAFAQGVADDRYVFWLGSGISRERAPGLDQLVIKVLEFLHEKSEVGNPDCPYRKALEKALELAALRPDEHAQVDLDQPPSSWPPMDYIVKGLVGNYEKLLGIRIDGKEADYLVWEAVDVRSTYGSGLEPDCEHLCLAILVLEGSITEMMSANWDGLIEAALGELNGDAAEVLRVVVLPEELRELDRDLTLLKFHGCAVLASLDPTKYRASIIATRSQITTWSTKPELKQIRDWMVSRASTKRTLMVGLSAQDENIQQLFAQADATLKWEWPTDPPAHVFADEALGQDHRNILEVVYREGYDSNAEEIETGALIQAYGKPLLTALVLYVLQAKLEVYLDLAESPTLPDDDRGQLATGLRHLSRGLAAVAEPNRLEFVRNLVDGQCRLLSLFREGVEPATGTSRYARIGNLPPSKIRTDATIATNGMRELAAGLALLGRGEMGARWSLSVDLSSSTSGALTVNAGGKDTKVFFAANGKAALHLQNEAIADPSAADTIVIHSTEPVKAAARSPRSRFGRSGHVGSRTVDMSALLKASGDLRTLEAEFRQAAAL
jgi:SIR2-like domain